MFYNLTAAKRIFFFFQILKNAVNSSVFQTLSVVINSCKPYSYKYKLIPMNRHYESVLH